MMTIGVDYLCYISPRRRELQTRCYPVLHQDLKAQARAHSCPHPDSLILHPRLLRSVADPASPREMVPRVGAHRYEMHFTEQRHQQRCLAGAGRPDDEVDTTTLKEQLAAHAEGEPASGWRERAVGFVVRPSEAGVLEPNCVLVEVGRVGEHHTLASLLGVRKLVQ